MVSLRGQYRLVRHTDDGCTIYQCMWCMGTVEIRDNPNYGWNFCPKCGRSWFTRLQCRPRTVPRWYWDHYGDPEEGGPSQWELMPPRREADKVWVLEHRMNVYGRWSGWSHLYSKVKDPFKFDYRDIYRELKSVLADQAEEKEMSGDEYFFPNEYRVRLIKR